MNYKIKVKTKWEDISIGDWQAISKLDKDEHAHTVLALLSDKTEQELLTWPLKVINSILKELDFMDGKIPDTNPINPLTIQGYGWELLTNPEDLTAGQFVDLTELMKDVDKNLHLIMAIILTKWERKGVFKKWKLIPYEKRDVLKDAQLLKEHMPIHAALSISSFFLTIYEESGEDGEAYLAKLKETVHPATLNRLAGSSASKD